MSFEAQSKIDFETFSAYSLDALITLLGTPKSLSLLLKLVSNISIFFSENINAFPT